MIRCIDVCKVYQQGDNQITALAGVSLEIPQGAFAAVMGQSGSGKSTLLHLIGGLDRPSNGELLVDDRLIGQMSDDHVTLFRRSKIGFIFQFFNLLPTLSAAENVALPFVLDGRSKSEADQRAAALLAKVGLQHRFSHTAFAIGDLQHRLPGDLFDGRLKRGSQSTIDHRDCNDDRNTQRHAQKRQGRAQPMMPHMAPGDRSQKP